MAFGHCDCGCSRDIEHLKEQVRSLEYALDAVKRDLDREVDERRDQIRDVRNALSEVA